jgi:hypothetical protein
VPHATFPWKLAPADQPSDGVSVGVYTYKAKPFSLVYSKFNPNDPPPPDRSPSPRTPEFERWLAWAHEKARHLDPLSDFAR